MKELRLGNTTQLQISCSEDSKEPTTQTSTYRVAKLERNLTVLNLRLTLLGLAVKLLEIVLGVVIWVYETTSDLIFRQYFFAKLVTNTFLIYRWIKLYRQKEPSHLMNHISVVCMFFLAEASIVVNSFPKGSEFSFAFVVVSLILNLCVVVSTTVLILRYRNYARKAFKTQSPTLRSKKLLMVLPVDEDTQGEYMHFKN